MIDNSITSLSITDIFKVCVDDLNDAEIERSIAEINEAIRRTAARRG